MIKSLPKLLHGVCHGGSGAGPQRDAFIRFIQKAFGHSHVFMLHLHMRLTLLGLMYDFLLYRGRRELVLEQVWRSDIAELL